MKPVKLSMQAFGPYAKVETVDFNELENRTMFLISGKTGSGKTTIFDGIAFAIYGKTSGEERSGTDLRSQFAEDSLLTEVTLWFELKNKMYKMIRSPQQDRKKARGDGFTTINSKAELYVYENNAEKLLAGNVREADEKIKEIMQLDFGQFKQILMIPQGEFRKLLVSDSKDKERILQRLFHTEIYTAFQEKLKAEAGELRIKVSQSVHERLKYFGELDPLDSAELKQLLLNEPIPEQQIIELAKNLVATQNKEKEILEKSIISYKKNRDALLQEKQVAIYLLDAFNQYEEMQLKQTTLIEQKKDMNGKREKLENAKKAETIWPLFLDLKEKRNAIELREQSISSYKESLSLSEEKLKKQLMKLEEIQSKKDENDHEKQQLRKIKELGEKIKERSLIKASLNTLKEEGVKQKTVLESLIQSAEEFEAKKTRTDERLQVLSRERVKTSEEKQLLQQLQYSLQNTKRALKLSDLFNQLEKKGHELQSAQEKVIQQTEITVQKKKEISELFYSSQAFHLAKHLENGTPCPVCGSEHHPDPVKEEKENVSENNLTYWEEELQKILTQKERNEIEIAQIKKRMAEVNDEKKELLSELKEQKIDFEWSSLLELSTWLNNSIRTSENRIQELKLKQNSERSLEEEKAKLIVDLEHINNKVTALNESIQEKRDKWSEMQGDFKRLNQDIPEEYLDESRYLKNIEHLSTSITLFEQSLVQAETTVTELKEECQTYINRKKQSEEELQMETERMQAARKKWEMRLAETTFSNEKEAENCLMDNHSMIDLENTLNTFEKDLYFTEQQLSMRKKELENKEKPAVARLDDKIHQVDQEIEMAEKEQKEKSFFIERHEKILKQINENKKETAQMEKEYELVGHLSDMANGKNHLRITFERYVLAFYLEDILSVANERLSRMTSGRYQLLRKEDRSKGNAQGGLELLVFDQYTGQHRHVKTLSGGEAFKASLSLALGLADVVQAHAGGVSLETMFIDEGFGTLDPESLDQAIESLMDIQSSGRLVGIISHVPELKERIEARLEVEQTKTGSTTRFIFTS
ncbi:SbcC/MukB-like Walker B domain-containing protein [Jeotgalibacillus sp. ET6]|uniref:SbcC/MukB-like Walker B domain-containing protein n=1 Tax=Jeotgalibacillus sp. ET6 TaxID=3037260 RepID=UPI0024187234|nr:SbcC/MukB-like Walker B domain-containing protein [Jeotgalibacillus sp. ET6]MDG5470401.1 SbcC/MukB-like Walker B domain-containing protein [Jeotgalibacillus sp. ET6]